MDLPALLLGRLDTTGRQVVLCFLMVITTFLPLASRQPLFWSLVVCEPKMGKTLSNTAVLTLSPEEIQSEPLQIQYISIAVLLQQCPDGLVLE